jgi:hypothetical protein
MDPIASEEASYEENELENKQSPEVKSDFKLMWNTMKTWVYPQ